MTITTSYLTIKGAILLFPDQISSGSVGFLRPRTGIQGCLGQPKTTKVVSMSSMSSEERLWAATKYNEADSRFLNVS